MLAQARKARCAPSTAWMTWERLFSIALDFPVSNLARRFEDIKTQDLFLPRALPLVVLTRATGWAELESRVLQNHGILEDGVGGSPSW